MRVKGVLHEFSTVPGVTEDMTDIILNLKKVAVKMHTAEKKTVRINAKGPCVVTAGMIETGTDVEIMNPNSGSCCTF